jgi:predicted Fe-S protein YdhL (DUF1289 family)
MRSHPGANRRSHEAAAIVSSHQRLQRTGAAGDVSAGSSVISPCISVCRMEPDTGLCSGCLRTLDEIAGWGMASDDEKRRVWSAIEVRRAGRTPAS